MPPRTYLARSFDEASLLLADFGDFHDATVLRLVLDYAAGQVEVYVDDVFSGLEGQAAQPGVIRIEGVQRIACQIPFVGGQVRIEGVEIQRTEQGLTLDFSLTTTEWLDVEDFCVVRLVVDGRLIAVS